MPVDYSVPSWVRGADPLRAVEAGASLGQRISESNQRAAYDFMQLQAQQARFSAEMQMRQQQLEQQQAFEQQKFQAQQQVQEQNQLREDQQLQIDNSYKQQALGLQQQKLQLTGQAAAQKLAAQQQFLTDRETIKNSLINEEGVDPDEAERRATIQALFRNGPMMGISPSSLASLSRSAGAQEAVWKVSPSGTPYAQEPSGNIRFEPRSVPKPEEIENSLKVKDLTKEIQGITKELQTAKATPDSNEKKQQEKIIDIETRLVNAQSKRHKLLNKKPDQPVQDNAPSKEPDPAPKVDKSDALRQAREAVAAGKDPQIIRQRLKEMGIDEEP